MVYVVILEEGDGPFDRAEVSIFRTTGQVTPACRAFMPCVVLTSVNLHFTLMADDQELPAQGIGEVLQNRLQGWYSSPTRRQTPCPAYRLGTRRRC